MRRKEQIEWIVKTYHREKLFCLDALNFPFERRFVEETGIELSSAQWKDRIRAAAKEMGLRGTRLYNSGDTLAGIPRYTVSYS